MMTSSKDAVRAGIDVDQPERERVIGRRTIDERTIIIGRQT
jgi:hypothetical protein